MTPPSDDAEIRAHADLVFRTCLRLTGNAQDAADVSQEVFIAWLQARGTIRGPLAAWLHGTARQRALDFLRRGHRRAQHERQAEAPADPAARDDWRAHLDEALADLDGTTRALVIEHHLLGVDQGRLAARFRCTQATVSRRLAKALERLRALLERRGVTVAPALLPPWFAREAAQPPCPADLVAPVLAQAQVAGAAGLLGPALIGGGWGWLGLGGAALALLAVLAIASGWWWRATALRGLDRDWTGVATAHLPPATLAVTPPDAGPRYPSIEALIARLPAVDAARQARVRALLDPDGQPVRDLSQAIERGGLGIGPFNPAQQEASDRAYALAKPLLAELAAGDALVGPAGWLDEDYRAGRLASWKLRLAWLQRVQKYSTLSSLTTVLGDQAERGADPALALDQLDALVTAQRRGCVMLLDGMIALSLANRRDLLHLRLIYADRVPEAQARRWCAEPCPVQALIGDAFTGEALLLGIPLIDDVRAGRSLEPLASAWDPLTGPQLAREMTWLPAQLATLDRALHGAAGARPPPAAAADGPERIWPALSASLAHAAQIAGAHRARRQAALLLLDARAGKALPEHLDLATGPADAWKVRYERVSPTRFRLVADPAAGRPAYVEEGAERTLVSKLGLPRAQGAERAFEDHGINGIEIEVPPPSVRPDLPPRSDEAVEPLPPRAVQ
jgi:RNA polymerase sigma factor (sigma-70 family)